MAWDGSGNFTRTNGTHTGSAAWGDDRDAGDNILASRHDTHDQDLADGIAACLTKNNETKPTATFKPNADNSYDLGSSALRWRRIYVAEVRDANANEVLIFSATASAVNEVTIANAATGNGPTISATGGDTDISINLTPKGTGSVRISSTTVKFTGALLDFTANTSDASDNAQIYLCAGGAVSASRGGRVGMYGNEHASSAGAVDITTGDVAGAYVLVASGTSSATLRRNAGLEINTTTYIGDTANAKVTLGLTINQAGADDEVLSLKSSDVAHGVTVITETDSFGVFTKTAAASGGLTMSGLRSAGAHSLVLEGFAPTPETTPATTARCFVEVAGFMTSGTGKTDTTANGLVFGVRTRKGGADTTIAVFDEDGDFFLDGAAGAAFDSWDDVALVRAFDVERAPHQVIRDEFDNFVGYNRADLVRAGILTDPAEGRSMVNVSQLQRLHNGALWQLAKRIARLEDKRIAH